jgi:ribosome-associated protein
MTDTTPRRPGPEVPADTSDEGAPPSAAAGFLNENGTDEARDFAVAVARLLSDYRCEDVLVLDVRGLSEVTNYLILATGTSDRQLKSAVYYLGDLAREHGVERLGSERDEAATWVVLDYVDVVVHLFEPVTRAHYDLEMLWGDAERVPWQREAAR